MDLRFRHARVDERRALEALQLRASLVWEEYRASLLAHPDAIELPDDQLRDGRVRVAERDGRVVGFSVVLPTAPGIVELDGLFVEPDAMRGGVGRALVEDALAQLPDARVMQVVANPRAEEFYVRVGFTRIGEAPTRFGPALRMQRIRS